MAKNIIGIDISDASIEAVALEKKQGRFEVEAYSRFRLSPDIVEDGKIIDPTKLKEAIFKTLQNAQPHSLEKYHHVILSVPESRVFSKVFSLPKNLKDKEMMEAIYNQAEGIIPDSFANLVSTFKLLAEKDQNREILFFASPIGVLKDLVGVFKELNMTVEAIVPEALSSFAGLDERFEKNTTLLLDIGARTTIATIFDKNGIRDSININIGGDAINHALMAKLSVSYAIADEKKKQIGLTSVSDGEVMLVIQGQLQPIADELKRFVAYYQESGNQKIEQIVIIGGLAQMKGIDKYFGDNLSLPAGIGESFIANNFLPPELISVKYINALGLARLAYKKPDIDFLPGLAKEESKNNSHQDILSVDNIEPKIAKPNNKFKSILTNKSFFVLLIIIILGILLFVFKDKFYAILNSGDNNVNQAVQPTNDNSVLNLPIKNIDKNFRVGVPADENTQDFILGEYYYVELSQSGSGANYSYDELLDFLDNKAQAEILSNLTKYFSRENYEIIPYILGTEIVKTDILSVDFKPEQSLTVNFKYKFLIFSKLRLAEILTLSGFNVDQNNWPKIAYEIINHSIEAERVS
ncbi:MAG: pilus assembly protein PilM, partial [bacterium]|nr:pilus assembly protein PilM [bacterium]